MVTIKDVASKAKVSPATVSNVLNGRGHASETTRQRVLQIVQDYGYRANIHAQQLVTQRSRIVAIKLPELIGAGEAGIPNSTFFLNIVNAATEAAEQLDYAVVVLPSRVSAGSFRRFGIDGYILVDPADHDAEFIAGTPTVTIAAGESFQGSSVRIDNDHAAALHIALEQFRAHRKNRTAIVKDSTHRAYVEMIANAFSDLSQSSGSEPLIFELESPELQELDDLLDTLLALKVDSIYATSDDIALGLLRRANERRVRVPEDLAIISAVDSLALTFTTPAISAMELFPRLAGEKALRSLVNAIESEVSDDETHLIPAVFISRGTV